MAENKRFQNKKLNKNDHKGVKKAAGGVKKAAGVVGAFAVIAPVIKKYGKTGLNLAKDIILKR